MFLTNLLCFDLCYFSNTLKLHSHIFQSQIFAKLGNGYLWVQLFVCFKKGQDAVSHFLKSHDASSLNNGIKMANYGKPIHVMI